MIKIDSGLQYHVFDIKNGRVRKTQTSFLHKLRTIHFYDGKYDFFKNPINNVRFAFGTKRTLRHSLDGLRDNLEYIDTSLLGNPRLLRNYSYEQDRVRVFGEVLQSTENLTDKKRLIDKYIENVLTCWGYGFSDSVFNFTINNGVTREGNVILLDLGEMTWRKGKVTSLLEGRELERQWSIRNLEDEELKNYVKIETRDKFTISNLNKLWKKKIEKP